MSASSKSLHRRIRNETDSFFPKVMLLWLFMRLCIYEDGFPRMSSICIAETAVFWGSIRNIS
jgi:hypothetical protein